MSEKKTTEEWRNTVAKAAKAWRTSVGGAADRFADNMLILAVDGLIASEADGKKRRKAIEAGRCKDCDAAYCICDDYDY